MFQLKSPWMDGANMITQCPIQPRNNFTYRFDITGQEGTLFWHAHVVNLRATLHGALIIRPRSGRPYPFPKPYKEVPLVFGNHSFWRNYLKYHVINHFEKITSINNTLRFEFVV